MSGDTKYLTGAFDKFMSAVLISLALFLFITFLLMTVRNARKLYQFFVRKQNQKAHSKGQDIKLTSELTKLQFKKDGK